jgi:hypothetical protein
MARLSRPQTKPYSAVLLRLAIIVVQVKHIRNIRLSALELDWQPVSCFCAFRVMRSAYLALSSDVLSGGSDLWCSVPTLQTATHMKCVNIALTCSTNLQNLSRRFSHVAKSACIRITAFTRRSGLDTSQSQGCFVTKAEVVCCACLHRLSSMSAACDVLCMLHVTSIIVVGGFCQTHTIHISYCDGPKATVHQCRRTDTHG